MREEDQVDPFGAWLEQTSYLSDRELRELPAWQQQLALIHQFALHAVSDGAGSVFYNNPEGVGGLASALEGLGEQELAEKIRAISGMLEAANPDDVVEYVVGPAHQQVEGLDAPLSSRWNTLYAGIEAQARAHGWSP